MAPGVNPQARGDYLDMERLRYDLICGVMGIPKGLVITDRSSGMSSGGVSDITYKIFMRTMEGIKYMLCELLGQVYEELYGDEDCIITLPFLPITSTEDIIRVADQVILNRKDAGLYMLRSLGLPESLLDLQPEQPESRVRDAPVEESTEASTEESTEVSTEEPPQKKSKKN